MLTGEAIKKCNKKLLKVATKLQRLSFSTVFLSTGISLVQKHVFVFFVILEIRGSAYSNQMEPGSSHMTPPDDGAGSDWPTLFDSFEEIELHHLERHRALKSKRSDLEITE